MSKKSKIYFVLQLILFITFISVALVLVGSEISEKNSKRWTDNFDLSTCKWSTSGRNDYFILEPGYQMILEGNEGKDRVRLEITVFDETRKVGDVETRIVEEKEILNGELAEISLNYFAVCTPSNDIFYFGETSHMYEEGSITDHEGSWLADGSSARPGLVMPSRPLLGARYYQEIAPEIAMDRAEVISDSELLRTPAGEFRNCLKIEETNPLEPGVKEYKVYSKGIGIVQDGDLILIRYGSTVSKE